MAKLDTNTHLRKIKNSRIVVNNLLRLVNIEDWEKCLSSKGDLDPVVGLHNPYSKITCLILYIYSMELG